MLIRKSLRLLLLAIVLCCIGCDDTPSVVEQSPAEQTTIISHSSQDDSSQKESSTAEPNSDLVTYFKGSAKTQEVVPAVVDQISQGDFDTASQIISVSAVQDDPSVQQLSHLINEYRVIQQSRKTQKEKTFQERLGEFNEIKVKGVPEDVNDMNEAFASIINAREYADADQKSELMSDPFVQQLIEKAKETAARFEREGKWIDAYANGYYWLSAIDKKNKEYKELAERMTDMAMIEMSLKDNVCETAAERHEGIHPEMFTRAIKALDFHYVDEIHYQKLAQKGFERCEQLGVVVSHSQEEIAYKVDLANADLWNDGLEKLQEEYNADSSIITRDVFVKLFLEIMDLNTRSLKLPEEVLVSQYSEAVMLALDPHTTLVWPWQVKDFKKNIEQEFTGIGIEISKATGDLKVVSLLPDTPAYTSGLDAEDIIQAINGEKVTKDMTIHCAVSKITGPSGTNVTLTVKHAESGEVEDITITRARIIVPTIKGWCRLDNGQWQHYVDPENKIGYVRITNFTKTTSLDMEIVLNQLEKNGLNGLILDLRYNTGGLLNSAADVVDKFITKGLIVKSQPRWGLSTYEQASEKGTHPEYPVIILINGGSASASEIVAGALQDQKYKRAVLVGERTFGKGSVQTISPYPKGGAQLKYTMAFYHLPSNQRVESRYLMEREGREDWGIAPDVEVKLKGNEIKKMLEMQRDNEILAKADHDNGMVPIKRYALSETIDSDPQLAVGILVCRARMLVQGKDLNLKLVDANVNSVKDEMTPDIK